MHGASGTVSPDLLCSREALLERRGHTVGGLPGGLRRLLGSLSRLAPLLGRLCRRLRLGDLSLRRRLQGQLTQK